MWDWIVEGVRHDPLNSVFEIESKTICQLSCETRCQYGRNHEEGGESPEDVIDFGGRNPFRDKQKYYTEMSRDPLEST